MPRILVPLLTLKPESASGVAHARNLVPALTRAPGAGEVLVLGTPFVERLLAPLGCRVETHAVAHARPFRLLATRRLAPRAAGRHRADALFVPDGQLVPAPGLPPSVVALHHHLNYSRPAGQALGQRLYWKLWYDAALRRSCARAAALIAPSAAFAREFEEHVPQAAGRLRVVPHGVGPAFVEEGPAWNEDRPHVLVVGNPSPYKNVAGAIAAFLAAAQGLPHRLLVAGLDERELGEAAARAGAPAAQRGRLVALGRLEQDELAPLYRGADALLFPSLVESFGLPVLEAMGCGTAVACSDLPSLRELTAGAARLADPREPAAMARALRPLLVDGGERHRRAEAGRERARSLSWDAAAASILAILREVAAAGR